MMNLSRLPDHPAFLRLSDADRDILFRSAEQWEAPAGSVLYHEGDSGEDLLLLLYGRLEALDAEPGARRWLPGDLWGEDRLAGPRPLERNLVAAEDSAWLRWDREALLALIASSRSMARGLAPLSDSEGRRISGLPEVPIASSGASTTGRRLRSSFRPAALGLLFAVVGAGILGLAVLRSEALPPLLPLVSPALFLGWFLVFLLKRLLTEYSVGTDALTARTFDWSRFAVESRHVPVDTIQGVEVERNGLARRILKYGTVIVKTSALEGDLTLRDVRFPGPLATEIRGYREAGAQRTEGRDRETMRRSLENSGLAVQVPRMVRAAETTDSGQSGGELRFRKSAAVLFGRLMLPLLVTAIPLLGADVIAGLAPVSPVLARAAALLPLFWVWYRFEDWRNDSFRVSRGYAIDLYRKPLGLRETRRQVDLSSVQNIRTEQKGIFSFLFRYGDVILVTAGGASDAVFSDVSRPWRVQAALFRSREEGLRAERARRSEDRKDDLVRFAEALDQIRGT